MTKNFLTHLSQAGFTPIEPSLFVAAEIVRHVSGEELSSKLFITQDYEGNELALRHDYTLPLTLHFLKSGLDKQDYCYSGKVFRQESSQEYVAQTTQHLKNQQGELYQSGAESFGRTDEVQADADCVAHALQATTAPLTLKMGDISLFLDLVKALNLPQAWHRHVVKLFRQGRTLPKETHTQPPLYPGLIQAMDGQNEAARLALIQDMLSIAGIKAETGRSAQEIAARFVQESTRFAQPLDPHKIRLLEEARALTGDPQSVYAQLLALTKREKIDLSQALARFSARNAALKERGISLEKSQFSLSFAREPDYYDGFIFELFTQETQKMRRQLCAGGGRYNKMTHLVSDFLRIEKHVPAVGFCYYSTPSFIMDA